MTASELAAVMKGIAPAIEALVAREIGAAIVPLVQRIHQLESRPPTRDGRDGKDGERGPQGDRGEPGLDGIDGKDGRNGIDGKDGAPGAKGEPGERGERGPEGPAGVSGRDGRDGQPGPTGPPGEKGMDGAAGRDGKDGVDGREGAPGPRGETGEKGERGEAGRDADMEAVHRQVAAELATWPRPKDGRDGKDGQDGLGIDDLDLRVDETGVYHQYKREAQIVKEVRLPCLYDAGPWKAGKAYDAGASVSWNGSLWIAQRHTIDRPGNGATAWRLAVKHGEPGKAGPEGKPGRDGRDLTNLGPDGAKWGQ